MCAVQNTKQYLSSVVTEVQFHTNMDTLLTNMTDLSLNTTLSVEEMCVLSRNWREVIMVVSFCLVLVIGVFGNLLILYAFIPRVLAKRSNSPTHLDVLIVYLGFCDLFASVFGPTVFIYWISTCHKRWDFGIVGCKILPSLSRIAINVSIGVVLIMAIDRCVVINAMSRRRKISNWMIHTSVVAVTLLSAASESYYIHSLRVLDINQTEQCRPERVVKHTYSIPLVTVICLRDLVFFFIFLTTTLLSIRKLRLTSTASFLGSFKEKRNMSNAKTIKLLMTMAGVFAFLVVPRDILHLVYTSSWMQYPEKDGIKDT